MNKTIGIIGAMEVEVEAIKNAMVISETKVIAGMTFLKALTGVDISDIPFISEDDRVKAVAVESVNNAFLHPFKITACKL